MIDLLFHDGVYRHTIGTVTVACRAGGTTPFCAGEAVHYYDAVLLSFRMEHTLARACCVCILRGSQNCPGLRDLSPPGLVYRLPSCVYRILRVRCFHFLLPERAIRL